MLKQIVTERWFDPKAVIGFWPAMRSATTSGSTPANRAQTPLATLHTLRQQLAKREGTPNLALADFVAPEAAARPIISAPLSSPPGAEKRNRERVSPRPTTIIARSW